MLGFGLLVRLGFKMTLFVIGARWIYAEAAIVAPGVLPLVDYALERVAIPTHDKWGEHYDVAREFALNFKEKYPEVFTHASASPVASADSKRGALDSTQTSITEPSRKVGQLLEVAQDSLSQVGLQLAQSGS